MKYKPFKAMFTSYQNRAIFSTEAVSAFGIKKRQLKNVLCKQLPYGKIHSCAA